MYGTYTDADPSATFDNIVKVATPHVEGAKKAYAELCSKLTYCPTPTKTHARRWPFRDPTSMKPRNYARRSRGPKQG
ncbi:MAG: hypothetical protein A4E57_04498 [Syntrophorhabdaceae bacterium PtaU1.Bin034]|nr:MAG: hypothetical protein A4E57_04498 [Syntrophorhabdaceae bacterium PtaU1.Bin034]